MSSAAHWRAVLAEVDRAGLCANPVRLRGLVLDRATGELRESELLVRCKDRRASVCPSCSRLYAKDAWHLVAAGIRGGKGVDASVAAHPQLFVTLTAPSFGPVHARVLSKTSVKPCRPRRAEICPHGCSLGCVVRHQDDSALLGEPLCVECFDYVGAILWNAHVGRLWVRTSLLLYRAVAAAGKMTESETRATLRLSYVKVVEFQRRGLVHLHVVLRADGAAGPGDPPPPWLDAEVLDAAVRRAAALAYVAVPRTAGTRLRRAGWGRQVDVRHLAAGDDTIEPSAIAAYIAKYATKTVDDTAGLAHPLRSVAHLERLGVRPHLARLVRRAWALGSRPELRHLALREHAHTLGYRGQFSSKSRRYSTTFAALRGARAAFARGEGEGDIDFDGEWRFGGRGYAHPDAAGLAEALTEAWRVPRGVPRGVPTP